MDVFEWIFKILWMWFGQQGANKSCNDSRNGRKVDNVRIDVKNRLLKEKLAHFGAEIFGSFFSELGYFNFDQDN